MPEVVEVRIRLDYNADPKNFLQQLQEAINEAGDNEQWLQIDTGFEEEGFSYVTGVYLSYEREKTQEELNQEALDREARIKAVEFKEEQCLLHMMLRNPDMARRLITQLSKEAKDETSPAL